MSRGNVMLLCLAFLAVFCSQSTALRLSEGNFFRKNLIMNSQAGIVDIKTNSNNFFYVDVDLSSSDAVRMILSLSNDETVVAENCLAFNYYNCSSHTCNKLSNTTTIDFPSFRAHVQYAQSSVSLDSDYWSLSSSNYLYIASSCVPGSSSSSLPWGLYGALGLGTGKGASDNFGYSPIFSILINPDLKRGKLLFKSDTSTYARSSTPLNTFSVNSTWQIPAENGALLLGNYSLGFSGNVIFDVNSRAIGLPQNLYNSFLTYFASLPGVHCSTSAISRSDCQTTLNIKDFPDFILSINGDQIRIPPQIYISRSSSYGNITWFNLNFKLTSPFYFTDNYVSPSFVNSIILDANFMSYYYTVFDATSGSNYIYLYPSINAPAQ